MGSAEISPWSAANQTLRASLPNEIPLRQGVLTDKRDLAFPFLSLRVLYRETIVDWCSIGFANYDERQSFQKQPGIWQILRQILEETTDKVIKMTNL